MKSFEVQQGSSNSLPAQGTFRHPLCITGAVRQGESSI